MKILVGLATFSTMLINKLDDCIESFSECGENRSLTHLFQNIIRNSLIRSAIEPLAPFSGRHIKHIADIAVMLGNGCQLPFATASSEIRMVVNETVIIGNTFIAAGIHASRRRLNQICPSLIIRQTKTITFRLNNCISGHNVIDIMNFLDNVAGGSLSRARKTMEHDMQRMLHLLTFQK